MDRHGGHKTSHQDDVAARKAIRTAVLALFMVVCLGIVLIWIMMPTNTYQMHWHPSIRQKTGSSTFFGLQGMEKALSSSFLTNNIFT